jgi:hypothetical protein
LRQEGTLKIEREVVVGVVPVAVFEVPPALLSLHALLRVMVIGPVLPPELINVPDAEVFEVTVPADHWPETLSVGSAIEGLQKP